MIERLEFAEVPAALVDERKVRLAGLICSLVSRELGLGGVEVRWVTYAHTVGYSFPREMRFFRVDNFNGMVRYNWPGAIFLRDDLELRQLVRTTAHECRHLFQAAQESSWAAWWEHAGPDDRADQEADATAYATRFARDLGW